MNYTAEDARRDMAMSLWGCLDEYRQALADIETGVMEASRGLRNWMEWTVPEKLRPEEIFRYLRVELRKAGYEMRRGGGREWVLRIFWWGAYWDSFKEEMKDPGKADWNCPFF